MPDHSPDDVTPTPDDIRDAAETLSQLTEYLRTNPDLRTALALMEPLLDEYAGLPIQLGDTLRAFARALTDNPTIPHGAALTLVADLRSAAWEQTGHHSLHYTLDELRAILRSELGTAQGRS
ncbi:hypothetical protein [Streptomyces sp. NPDC005760]|uniref:hypothetical protein n=1 Tax=Streptomyces sp. NPDC005760 TaxID=3156718 RepID=UPI0033E914F1